MPEPTLTLEIVVPDEFVGDILQDLSARRTHILTMKPEFSKTIISARVPVAEMANYTDKLAALTDGRGTCAVLDWASKG